MRGIFALFLAVSAAAVDALTLNVAASGGNSSSAHIHGIMFEDINYCGDGGLYAELIRNRAFQNAASVSPFTAVGGTTLSLQRLSQPLSTALPQSMRVTGGSGVVGFSNPGWWGIDVKVQKYTGSFHVKGTYSGTFTASLVSATNERLGSVEIESKSNSNEWTEHTFTLTPTKAATNSRNTFTVTYEASDATDGYLDFNLISLFPPTYNDRPNGLRPDIMEAFAKLNPSFLRFPGGNNLEGQNAGDHWKWEKTIGPLKDRAGRPGTWGYFNTDGLGLVEYMQWTDDLGIEPVLGAFAGLYLGGTVISQAALQPYIDDFLNELEFLTGSVDTEYGALRASLGYPEPWKVNYVEVGNEDNLNGGAASYVNYRFNMFYDAIKAKYPNMTVFASYVYSPLPGDAGVDYHTYDRPNRIVNQFNLFDQHNRKNPVIIGEYAVINYNRPGDPGVEWSGVGRPIFPYWLGSVSEAVFLIGAERNSDVVWGTAYAPLMMNTNSYQWTPDLIAFNADPAQTVTSSSHDVIALLSKFRMTHTLPVNTQDNLNPVYWVAGSNAETGSKLLKAAVYNSTGDVPVTATFEGVAAGAKAKLTYLAASDVYATNAVGTQAVPTTEEELTASSGGTFTYSLPNLSVSVLEVFA